MILNRISFFLSTIYYLFIISSTDRFYDYIYNVRVWIFHDGFTLAFFFLIVRRKVQSEVWRGWKFFFFLFLFESKATWNFNPAPPGELKPSTLLFQPAKLQNGKQRILARLSRSSVVFATSLFRFFFFLSQPRGEKKFSSQQCFSILFPLLFFLLW